MLFVFISFPMKKYDNLAFMATLAEPPLGIAPTTPKPFVIWPMIFAISLCYSWLYHVAPWRFKRCQGKPKVLWTTLFVPLWFLSSSCASKTLSILGYFGAYLPPFPLMGSSNGTNKESPPSLNSSKECKATCISSFLLGSRIYLFLLFFLGAMGGPLYQRNLVCLNFSLALGNRGRSPFLD